MGKDFQFNLLVVDDEAYLRSALKRSFMKYPYHLSFAESGQAALDYLAGHPVDLMLLDLRMPGMDGLATLEKALSAFPGLKVIMLTGHGGVRPAVAAIQKGAVDFYEKSTSLDLLEKKIGQIYNLHKLENENKRLREKTESHFNFEPLKGDSPPMLKLKDMIARIGPTDTSILIQGESGTGKELVARAIHEHSLRKNKSFIPVDCAAITETVMESELFGHCKGAFTGANQSSLGLVRAADKGTLFLDEIGELSLGMQAKLLRTLQEHMVRPVGSVQAVNVDIRIIAATNRNLVDAVAAGLFRQDLYYRLSGVTLYVAPLRERIEDIELLCRNFIDKASAHASERKKMSESALSILRNYAWPGNIRELENVLRRALVFCAAESIEPENLPVLTPAAPAAQSNMDSCSSPASLSVMEEKTIREALSQTAGNRRKAAALLGISEATLYRRIKQYGF